jgi:hypothetical protein
MGSDSDASLLAMEPGVGNDTRPPASRRKPSLTTLKYLLFVAIPVIWVAASFLSYPAPVISEWLIWMSAACLLALLLLFLSALFRRRWKEVAIFCAAAPVVLLPYLGLNVSLDWIYVAGFRFHASPIEEYMSRCELIEFIEKNFRQEVGICERQSHPGNGVVTVIYDTTGELVLPVTQRTPEWTKAMGRFSPGKVFTKSEGRAQHLFGHFYDIEIGLEDMDGAADDL